MNARTRYLRPVLLLGCAVIALALAVSQMAAFADTPGNLDDSSGDVAIADSFLAAGRADRNLNGETLWLGYDQSGGYGDERIILKFRPTAPTPGVVQRARLVLSLGGTTAPAPLIVTAHRVRVAWNEGTVTWNDVKDAFDPATDPPTSVSGVLDDYTWDVTSLYKAWLQEQPRPGELSILLRSTNATGQNERIFWSKDCAHNECGPKPVLVVELEPSPTPTRTLTPTPTRTTTPNTCWAAWQSSSVIVLPGQGSRDVRFDYGSCGHKDADLQAELTGAAVFDGEAQATSVPLTGGEGALKVYPAAGATPGARFWLAAKLGDDPLPTREGVVGRSLYLPVTVRGSAIAMTTPTVTPTSSITPSPTQTTTIPATLTPSLTPSATSSRTPSTTPSLTPTDVPTSTPSTTPTTTPTLTPTYTPTATPTPTRTPDLNETVKGTVWKMPANLGLYGVLFELRKSNGTNCGQLVPLTPQPATDIYGRYSITTSGKTPYSICIKPITPSGCSEIAAETYARIIAYTQEGQVIAGPASLVDFRYNCP